MFTGGKGGRCVGVTTLPPLCVGCLEIWESHPPGTLRVCPGLYRDLSTLTYKHVFTFVNVKCNLVQALRLCTGRTARRGSRGIALLFLDNSTRMGEWSASRLGRYLPPTKTRYPLYVQEAGWAPGPVWTNAKNLPPPLGFEPQTAQPLASRYTE